MSWLLPWCYSPAHTIQKTILQNFALLHKFKLKRCETRKKKVNKIYFFLRYNCIVSIQSAGISTHFLLLPAHQVFAIKITKPVRLIMCFNFFFFFYGYSLLLRHKRIFKSTFMLLRITESIVPKIQKHLPFCLV